MTFPPLFFPSTPSLHPPNLDCTPISMLNHSGVGAFRPFASSEDRESYQSAFTPAKRLKNCHDTDSPHLRFSDADGKEYEFGTQLPSSSLPLPQSSSSGCCMDKIQIRTRT